MKKKEAESKSCAQLSPSVLVSFPPLGEKAFYFILGPLISEMTHRAFSKSNFEAWGKSLELEGKLQVLCKRRVSK